MNRGRFQQKMEEEFDSPYDQVVLDADAENKFGDQVHEMISALVKRNMNLHKEASDVRGHHQQYKDSMGRNMKNMEAELSDLNHQVDHYRNALDQQTCEYEKVPASSAPLPCRSATRPRSPQAASVTCQFGQEFGIDGSNMDLCGMISAIAHKNRELQSHLEGAEQENSLFHEQVKDLSAEISTVWIVRKYLWHVFYSATSI